MNVDHARLLVRTGGRLRSGSKLLREGGRLHNNASFVAQCICGRKVTASHQRFHDDWTCEACRSRTDNVIVGHLACLYVEAWLTEHWYRDVRRAQEGGHPDFLVLTESGWVGVEVRTSRPGYKFPDKRSQDRTDYYATWRLGSGSDGVSFFRVTGRDARGQPQTEEAPLPRPPVPLSTPPRMMPAQRKQVRFRKSNTRRRGS